jgi:hypothetical protein
VDVNDSPWGCYPETILLFPELQLRIDLRDPLGAETATLLRGALGDTFAVVTADYPNGMELTDSENEVRFDQLREYLNERDLQYIRADGVSTDDAHCERGVAVIAEQGLACEIATHFNQLGIFWFDGNGFWLVPVIRQSEAVRLPV